MRIGLIDAMQAVQHRTETASPDVPEPASGNRVRFALMVAAIALAWWLLPPDPAGSSMPTAQPLPATGASVATPVPR